RRLRSDPLRELARRERAALSDAPQHPQVDAVLEPDDHQRRDAASTRVGDRRSDRTYAAEELLVVVPDVLVTDDDLRVRAARERPCTPRERDGAPPYCLAYAYA